MQTSSTSSTPATSSAAESRPDAKPPLAIRAPMTAHEANLSSVFDACIPGNLLMYPVNKQDRSSK